jgi:hypothetical protein
MSQEVGRERHPSSPKRDEIDHSAQ